MQRPTYFIYLSTFRKRDSASNIHIDSEYIFNSLWIVFESLHDISTTFKYDLKGVTTLFIYQTVLQCLSHHISRACSLNNKSALRKEGH